MNKRYLIVIFLLMTYAGFAQTTFSKYEAERYSSMSGINTGATSDTGGGQNVGRLEENNWVKYNVSVDAAGTYTFNFRVAGNAAGQFEVRNSSGTNLKTVDVPVTGGWQKWTTVSVPVILNSGSQTIQIYVKKNGWNFNWFEVSSSPIITSVNSGSTRIEAERYTSMSGIKTENTTDISGGQNVGRLEENNWVKYNVSVDAAGTYTFNFRVAGNAAGQFEVRNSSGTNLKTVDVPVTGGWQKWTTVSVPVILNSGSQTIQIYVKKNGWNFNWFEIGSAATTTTEVQKTQAVITFNALTDKTVGDAAYALEASSTNTTTPVTFASSNPTVVSVSNATGKWLATVVAAGTANITASQVSNNSFLVAANVIRTQVVNEAAAAPPVTSPEPVLTPEPTRKSGILTFADYNKNWMYLAAPKPESQNFDKIMNGVLNEKVNVTWDWTLYTKSFWMTFPQGMEMTLEKLRMYDYYGTMPEIKVWFIKRDATKVGGIDWNRVPGPVYKDLRSMVWDEYKPAQPLDIYAMIFEFTGSGLPPEIEITGSWKPYQPAAYKHKEINIKSALKTNGYIWNIQNVSGRPVDEEKMELFKAFKGIRDYVDWVKIEGTKGQYTFDKASEGGWRYDLVYERLKNEGIDVHACFKTQPAWALAEFGYSPDNNTEFCVAPWTKLPVPVKPSNATAEQTALYNSEVVKYNADIIKIRENAASYSLFCQAAFQYVARYGSNTALNPNLVKVAGNQTKKIGLGYVKSIECNNEMDASWHGRKRYMTPREYAFYLSAFYDGHMNTMGPGIGVKNADPNMLVVAGGIASNRPEYFQGVIEAWKEIRGYKMNAKGELVVNMACDIWNYHAYSNNGGGQFSNASWGLPPELSNSPTTVKNFLQVIAEEGNDLPVWITETGYGVNGGSQQALATPTRTKVQSQGDWTIRTILFNIRHGIAETYFYQAYDESAYVYNVASGIVDNGTYGAMGLIERTLQPDGSSVLKRRPAADYMRQMQLFQDFVYQQTISEDPLVDVYQYEGKKMYALAVPDMVGRTKVYTLDLGSATQAYVYRFVDGAEELARQTVPVVGGKLTLTVSETPMFVSVSPIVTNYLTSAVKPKSSMVETTQSITAITLASYPNPITKEATIEFVLPEADQVTLELHDLTGKKVKHLFSGQAEAGTVKSYNLNAEDLTNGVYVVRLITSNKVVTEKIIVAK